jgi:hypothetical protein
MSTDNFCFYLQNKLIQTSQTGGQRYSDTSLFSIPWSNQTLIVRQPFEMITTLFEMHLLNDTSQICGTYFIRNGKEWGEGQIEGANRKRVRGGVCEERVAAWVINLTVGQVFMRA